MRVNTLASVRASIEYLIYVRQVALNEAMKEYANKQLDYLYDLQMKLWEVMYDL